MKQLLEQYIKDNPEKITFNIKKIYNIEERIEETIYNGRIQQRVYFAINIEFNTNFKTNFNVPEIKIYLTDLLLYLFNKRNF